MLNKNFLKSNLGRRFLINILLVSSFITLILTVTQLYSEYRGGMNRIDKTLHEIEKSQLETLTQSIWMLNDVQIVLQLKGLIRIEDIKYLGVKIAGTDEIIQIGDEHDIKNKVTKEFPLFHKLSDDQRVLIGTLKIVVSVDNLYRTLARKSIFILITQTAKTFMVSLFILIIFQRLIVDPFAQLTALTKSMGIETLSKEITINRWHGEGRVDELDEVVIALNTMRSRLSDEVLKLELEKEQNIKLLKKIHDKDKLESLGKLASGIAQNFQLILESLKLAIEKFTQDILAMKLSSGGVLGTDLEMAKKLVTQGENLVKKVELFSSQTKSELFVMNLNAIVLQAINEVQSKLPPNIKLLAEIPDAPININLNPEQVHQLILNLLLNASNAIESNHGQIEIKLEKTRTDVSLKIKDNGKGISEKDIDKVFTPFYTTKNDQIGAGLGLTIVEEIVRLHDGKIKLESKENLGTEISISFPLAEMKERESINKDEELAKISEKDSIKYSTAVLENKIIALLDDEVDLIILCDEILSPLGCKVKLYTSPIELLESLKSGLEIDLLISDYSMPNMNGDVLAKKLKKILPNLPILMISGFKKHDEFIQSNILEIIEKPFSESKLIESVCKVFTKI